MDIHLSSFSLDISSFIELTLTPLYILVQPLSIVLRLGILGISGHRFPVKIDLMALSYGWKPWTIGEIWFVIPTIITIKVMYINHYTTIQPSSFKVDTSEPKLTLWSWRKDKYRAHGSDNISWYLMPIIAVGPTNICTSLTEVRNAKSILGITILGSHVNAKDENHVQLLYTIS